MYVGKKGRHVVVSIIALLKCVYMYCLTYVLFVQITRSRNKWKFYLKDGIMNLSGKDFVFLKANGDAEW